MIDALYILDTFLELIRSYIELYLTILNTLRLNPISNYIVTIIMFLAFSVWSIFSAYHIIGLIAYKRYKPLRGEYKTPAELVIVTVGNNKVKDSLIESIEENSRYGTITVLTDDGAELIDYIRRINVNLITVPKTYRNDLIGKGRALNYFAEYLAENDKWYIFLDDDNILLADDIFYEISVYNKLKYAAANPILIPRRSNSKVTYIMDWMRYFDDLLTFRAFTGLFKKPLIGMHGEMFTVRGDILKE